MNTSCHFYISKAFQAKVEVAKEAWRNGKDVFSVEVCAAIIERHSLQQVRGFVMPRLDQPAIDLASLLTEGKISAKEGHEILAAMEQHELQCRKLKSVLAIAAEAEKLQASPPIPEQ